MLFLWIWGVCTWVCENVLRTWWKNWSKNHASECSGKKRTTTLVEWKLIRLHFLKAQWNPQGVLRMRVFLRMSTAECGRVRLISMSRVSDRPSWTMTPPWMSSLECGCGTAPTGDPPTSHRDRRDRTRRAQKRTPGRPGVPGVEQFHCPRELVPALEGFRRCWCWELSGAVPTDGCPPSSPVGMKYCVDNRNRGGFQSAKLLGKKCPSTALVRVERACKCMYIIYCVYIYTYWHQ